MCTLRLFGSPSIEGEKGPLTGPPVQRHRLALLALLGIAHPGGLTRDKLVAYLWPERDAEHARNLLRQGTHVLRRALGEGAILTVGDELRLDPDHVWVDVVRFRAAIESGDLEDAVALHRGPFLDGFFLPDAAQFERWSDVARTRLRDQYRDALWGLAETAAEEGDRAGAVHWWRRLAAEDPSNSRVALELMQALELAGERARAIQHARVHALVLQDRFGAVPDPGVAALAERMRMAPEGASELVREPALSGGRPVEGLDKGEVEDGSTHRLPSRIPKPSRERRAHRRGVAFLVLGAVGFAGWFGYGWNRGTPSTEGEALPAWPTTLGLPDGSRGPSLAVLPFHDLSPEANQAWFADGIAEEILSTLSRVAGLDVTARQSSFAFRGRPVDVREIGRELGVGAVLEGSVRTGGDSVWVTAQLSDAASGFQLWSGTFTKVPTAENLRGVQAEIARDVAAALDRRYLGEADPEPGRPDDEAYDLYLEGRSLLRFVQTQIGGDGSEQLLRAVGLFREAVAQSPDWAPGWVAFGEALHWLGSMEIDPALHYPKSKAALERALELDPRNAKAYASLGFVLQTWEFDFEGAEERYLQALALGRADGWHGYGMLLAATGRHDEAVEAFRSAEAHDPLSLLVKNRLLRCYVCSERYEDAIAYAERGLALGRGPWPLWSLTLALERSGRADRALARIDEVSEAYALGPGWDLSRAILLSRSGRTDEARDLIRRFEQAVPQVERLNQVHAAALLAVGDHEDPIALLDRMIDPATRYLILDCRLPELRLLSEDPRYPEVLRRQGLPHW